METNKSSSCARPSTYTINVMLTRFLMLDPKRLQKDRLWKKNWCGKIVELWKLRRIIISFISRRKTSYDDNQCLNGTKFKGSNILFLKKEGGGGYCQVLMKKNK